MAIFFPSGPFTRERQRPPQRKAFVTSESRSLDV